MRVGARLNQMRDAMGERIRLARAGACDDEKRRGPIASLRVKHGTTLRFVERFQPIAHRCDPMKRTIVR
jgi:hypothetical protein